jgi:hypothetical protein
MNKIKLIPFIALIFCSAINSEDIPNITKADYYDYYVAPAKGRIPERLNRSMGYADRKLSVLDKGNMVLRMSNAAIYGYDRWGLNHEFPAGSMAKTGCCTYYWTQSPMVGALIDGLPTVSVGVRGSVRDHEEEFEPLPGYDAGYADTDANIGIAFSDVPESWPALWAREKDPTGTFESVIYNADGSSDTLYFPGIEPELGPDGFPDAPCGLGVQADREAYFVVTDNDPQEGNTFESNQGVGPLNVRFDVWVLNYSSTFGNDGLIFIQKMTNVGKDTLKDLYMGIAGDPDAPEQGGAEWTDDMALLITENDPHIAEKLVDTSDAHLLENFAIVYDRDDAVEGYLTSGVGWIGVKFLDLTKFNSDGTDSTYGVSTFYTFEYSMDAQSDAQAYNEQMTHGIQTPHHIEPYEYDSWQKPYSYGPDITWVIAGGPMDVAPGEQVIFTFADFVGINETDLTRNAKLFQSLYDNNCATPKPPNQPVVQATVDKSKVVLMWDDRSEFSLDPVTGKNAFQGYRVYRSTDRGNTWGTVITDVNGDPTDFFKPLAIYDYDDNVGGAYAMTDPRIYYNLGSNTGLKYSFVDNNIINGYEYWYAVSAYDGVDDWAGAPVDPMENPKAKNAFYSDDDNTIAIVAQGKAAGYTGGSVPETATHTSGESDAVLNLIPADAFTLDFLGDSLSPQDFKSKGYSYKITFNQTIVGDTATVNSWNMINTSTGDTVVVNDTDVESGQLKHVIDGFIPVFSLGSWSVTSFDSAKQTVNQDTAGAIFFNGINPGSNDGTWAGFVDNTPLDPKPSNRPASDLLQKDIEFRFSTGGSVATYFNPTVTVIETIDIPFEIWSIEDNKKINAVIYMAAGSKPIHEEDADNPGHYKFTKNFYVMPVYEDYTGLAMADYYTNTNIGWMFQFNKNETLFQSGDVFNVYFRNPLLPGDVYDITTEADVYTVTEGDLDEIVVVPNPYNATSVYEHIAFIREVQFMGLPEQCLIRIFNTAGELVQVIKHDVNSPGYRGPSIEAWDLRTYNNQEVSFGVYVFHVISNDQEFTGKLAVIK